VDSMFDIFKGLPDGTFLWVTAVRGLQEAHRYINQLALMEPGRYLIHSQQRGFVVEHVGGSENHSAI
jgi:hypothetical protein